MLQKTFKLLIGKDINRDTDRCTDGAALSAFAISDTGLAEGEVLVLDKNKLVLAAGSTKADTDTIYLVQGTGDTFTYTNTAGTSITARKVVFSDPIQAANVRSFKAKSYTAKAEKTATFDFTGLTPVVGTEYIIRVIYKDMVEHPGQFTQTFRYVSTTATLATWCTAVTAKINAYAGRRIQATTNDATSLVLTAKEIPQCCTALTDIDEFWMVDFIAVANYVDSNNNWKTIPSTSTAITYTGPTFGAGNWEQIRDLEKGQWGYVGVTNRIHFPVFTPTMSTVVDAYYDQVIIEHDTEYLSPDNQYRKKAPMKTILALAVGSDGTQTYNQAQNILDRLNPWMESCGFDSVTI